MKSLESLWRTLLAEAGSECGVCTTRDWKTAASRFEHEGWSFFTITLPSFAVDFQKSLADEVVGHDLFPGFQRRGGFPQFLGGFLGLVFDRGDGTLLDEPDIRAIASIRLLTMAFGKMLTLPSEKRARRALMSYIQIEEELKAHDREYPVSSPSGLQDPDLDTRRVEALAWLRSRAGSRDRTCLPRGHLSQVARRRHHRVRLPEQPKEAGLRDPDLPSLAVLMEDRDGRGALGRAGVLLFGPVLCALEHALRHVEDSGWRGNLPSPGEHDARLIPRHGPGATSDRLIGNQKFQMAEWPERLEAFFPYSEWALPSFSHWRVQDRVHFLTPEEERPSRVILIPKTAKTPRVIADQPTAMMYVQQAISRQLVRLLESDPLVGPLIGFRDQLPNQEMARRGSRDGSLATLDLSEASDRVSNQHVRALLSRFPLVRDSIEACRVRKADVPGFGVIRLAKFASMGSALTFPLEAMIFLSIVVSGISRQRRVPLSRKFIKQLAGEVRVYGDDIIVPTDCAVAVIDELDTFGYRVNRSKSFWTGKFRESCGGDFYDGHDVTPVRIRKGLPSRRQDVEEVESLVSLRNQLYHAGYWEAVKWLDARIVGVLPHFPICEPTSPILARESVAFRWDQSPTVLLDRHSHAPVVQGFERRDTLPTNAVDDVYALMKVFLYALDPDDLVDEDHLLRSGRVRSSHIKPGWREPF